MNGISDVKSISGHGENMPSSSKTSEEWPDWSEPEEPENKTVNIQVWPPEPHNAARPPAADLNVVETWDDSEMTPGAGITASTLVTSGDSKATPTSRPLTDDPRPLTSSLPQKTSPAPSMDDPDETQPPKVSSRERRLKTPTEFGLGEEFTIQVKKKPVPDPELDWFADMIPEIKPSAAILVLPELRTEAVVPNQDGVSPVMMPFSSKFAAAEITEVRVSLEGTRRVTPITTGTVLVFHRGKRLVHTWLNGQDNHRVNEISSCHLSFP